MVCRSNDLVDSLRSENKRLRDALSGLMPWVGCLPDGPPWATPKAKARNREMFDEAFSMAQQCLKEPPLIRAPVVNACQRVRNAYSGGIEPPESPN